MDIGIDIDDTLTNSFDYFQPYVAEYFNVGVDYLKEINFFRTYYDKVVAFTPFKKNASKVLNKLKELGHRIIIITGRT